MAALSGSAWITDAKTRFGPRNGLPTRRRVGCANFPAVCQPLRPLGLLPPRSGREAGIRKTTMPRTPPQVYVGRKLCDGPCGRWRHDVDFKPRWKKFKKKPKGIKRDAHNVITTVKIHEPDQAKPIWVKGPYYDNLCASCRNARTLEQHRIKLEMMTEEERLAYNKHRRELEHRRVYGNTERNEKLRARLANQIRNAKAVVGAPRRYEGEMMMPLLPFRLYLLRQLRQGYTTSEIGRIVHRDEAEVRRWAEGIYWEGGCNPQPIHNISLGTVDSVLVGLGESPYKLTELYPWKEKEK